MALMVGVGAGYWRQGAPNVIRRQQGGGSIMIWGGIVKNRFIEPFKVEKGVKMNSQNYTAF